MSPRREDAQYIKMTETPVANLVVILGIPTTISMLVTSIYNMADTAFVGTLGTSASGAIGVVFGYMAILQAIGFMFGQGSGSQIARMLGQRDSESASRIASTGFLTAMGLGVLVAVGSWFFLDDLLRFLGSSETILPHARAYCGFILLGAPFITGSFVLNNILRFEGLAMKAMIGLVTGAVLNLICDPLLIFVFHMGTAGAGLATAFSQIVSFCILLSMFLRGVTQSRLSFRSYTRDYREVLRIIAIGFPSLLRQAMSSIGTIILNRCARAYGDAAVAAMAIVSRISMFIFSVGLGLGQGYQPVCSFNYGAGKYSRVRAAFRATLRLTMIILVFFSLSVYVAAPRLVRFFRDDPAVIAIGVQALRYACFVMWVLPVSVLTNMTLQSTGQALPASFLALLRSGLFFLPVLLILNRTLGIVGIEVAQPIADVLTAATSIPFVLYFFRHLPQENSL
ncbi:MAG: MATE family efflux transporter [Eubacteriales bacterium]|nr:MATE family efflux transporter [Eubacteriales bacterium]